MTRKTPGLFITGTGTAVGKTYVAAIIARSLAEQGLRVGVYKPAMSGFALDNSHPNIRSPAERAEFNPGSPETPDDQVNLDDASLLWIAAGKPGQLELVCPQRFAAPLAPHLAARVEGKQIDSRLLRLGVEYWCQTSDIVIVEGAGGLLAPISDHECVADLALDFQFPLVIVSANQLGTINHTLLTIFAAQRYRGGLPIGAIVLNDVRERSISSDPSMGLNCKELKTRCTIPNFTTLTWQKNEFEPQLDWMAVASCGIV